jgi:hydrogenase maturation protease
MGNPLLCDDMAGLLVVEQARERFAASVPDTDFFENTSGGFDLLYELSGYTTAIIIDSIKSGSCQPGTLIELKLNELAFTSQPRLVDSHGLNLATIFDVAKKCCLPMPENVTIIGIESTDFFTFADHPTAPVNDAIAIAVDRVGLLLGITSPLLMQQKIL